MLEYSKILSYIIVDSNVMIIGRVGDDETVHNFVFMTGLVEKVDIYHILFHQIPISSHTLILQKFMNKLILFIFVVMTDVRFLTDAVDHIPSNIISSEYSITNVFELML